MPFQGVRLRLLGFISFILIQVLYRDINYAEALVVSLFKKVIYF